MSRPPVQTDIVEASRVVRTPHLVADRVTATVLDGVLAPPLPANAIFTTLTVSGVSSLGPTSVSNLGVTGPLSVGDLSASGNLFVTGTTSIAGMSADSVQTNGLDVVANAVVGGTLGVTGEISTPSSATVGGDLGVSGSATVSTNLSVVGATGLTGDLTAAGNASVGGTLDVTGDTTLSGNADVAGNGTVGGTLDVTGNIGAASDASVGGNLSVTGSATVTGTASAATPTLGPHLTTLDYVRRQAEVTRVTISAGSIPNNSAYTMPFDTVQWDPNGNWDSVAFRYTAPKGGFYAISLAIRVPLASGFLRCYLQGGTDFAYGTEVPAVSGGSTTTTLNTVYGFGPGDQFVVNAFQNSGVAVAPQAGFRFTYLSIHYLGEIAAL